MFSVSKDVYFDEVKGVLAKNEAKISVGEKEKMLLLFFLENSDRTIKKEEVIKSVWGGRESIISDANLAQLVYRLRRTLMTVGLHDCIKTLPRLGYLYITPCQELPSVVEPYVKESEMEIDSSFIQYRNLSLGSLSPGFFSTTKGFLKHLTMVVLVMLSLVPVSLYRSKGGAREGEYQVMPEGRTVMLRRKTIREVKIKNDKNKLIVEIDTVEGPCFYNISLDDISKEPLHSAVRFRLSGESS